MQKQSTVWMILTLIGAIPCVALFLYGIHGMIFGSPFSEPPGMNGPYDFTLNILVVLRAAWILLVFFLPVLLVGLIGGFIQVYMQDKRIWRIILFLMCFIPMIVTICLGTREASQYGILISEFSPTVMQGNVAIIPWTVTYMAQFWYIHLIPLLLYPLSIMKTKK